jgi:hypothetical protein
VIKICFGCRRQSFPVDAIKAISPNAAEQPQISAPAAAAA